MAGLKGEKMTHKSRISRRSRSDGQKSRRPLEVALFVMTWLLVVAAFVAVYLNFFSGGILSLEQDEPAATSQSGGILWPDALYYTLGGEDTESFAKAENLQKTTLFAAGKSYLEILLEVVTFRAQTVSDEISLAPKMCFYYTSAISSDILEAQFSLEEDTLPNGEWNKIWIIPATSVSGEAVVILSNSETGRIVLGTAHKIIPEGAKEAQTCYTLDENAALITALQTASQSETKDYILEGETSVFVRSSSSSGKLLYQGTLCSAFGADQTEDEQEESKAAREAYGLLYFANEETMTRSETGSSLIFNDEKLTLRVDEDGRIIYMETLTDLEKESLTLPEAYSLAETFLKTDKSRLWDSRLGYVLSGAEVTDSGYLFTFDYTFNDLPITLLQLTSSADAAAAADSDETAETGTAVTQVHAITITVEGRKVRRYERWALEFSALEECGTQPTWLEALNYLTLVGAGDVTNPEVSYVATLGGTVAREGSWIFKPVWTVEAAEGESTITALCTEEISEILTTARTKATEEESEAAQ